MSNTSLYDEDILLWSEQQAEIVRKLGRTRRDLPNEFDVANVAEEIESVGRSELAAVTSNMEQILAHLIKLAMEPDSGAQRHWRSEIFGFYKQMMRRYAPSMRLRVGLDEIWASLRQQLLLRADTAEEEDLYSRLPTACPFDVDELLADPPNSSAMADRLRALIAPAANGT